jgi:hypothetical protein
MDYYRIGKKGLIKSDPKKSNLAIQEPKRRVILSGGSYGLNGKTLGSTRVVPFPYVLFLHRPGKPVQVFFANELKGLDTKLYFPTLPNLYQNRGLAGTRSPPEMCTVWMDKPITFLNQIDWFWRASFTSGNWKGYSFMLSIFRGWRGWSAYPLEDITSVKWPSLTYSSGPHTLRDVVAWNKEQGKNR